MRVTGHYWRRRGLGRLAEELHAAASSFVGDVGATARRQDPAVGRERMPASRVRWLDAVELRPSWQRQARAAAAFSAGRHPGVCSDVVVGRCRRWANAPAIAGHGIHPTSRCAVMAGYHASSAAAAQAGAVAALAKHHLVSAVGNLVPSAMVGTGRLQPAWKPR